MFPGKSTYKYNIEYLVVGDEGRHKANRTIDFKKTLDSWTPDDYSILEDFLKRFHKGDRVDINIIEVTEAK